MYDGVNNMDVKPALDRFAANFHIHIPHIDLSTLWALRDLWDIDAIMQQCTIDTFNLRQDNRNYDEVVGFFKENYLRIGPLAESLCIPFQRRDPEKGSEIVHRDIDLKTFKKLNTIYLGLIDLENLLTVMPAIWRMLDRINPKFIEKIGLICVADSPGLLKSTPWAEMAERSTKLFPALKDIKFIIGQWPSPDGEDDSDSDADTESLPTHLETLLPGLHLPVKITFKLFGIGPECSVAVGGAFKVMVDSTHAGSRF
ncbi:hypothetical protein H0H92_001575 [Tricholoma furcatifolium]|nr:hypothetical protein H0H92_001575 [Tricholoma furcatifolium]